MSPSKKKAANPKEVSLEETPKTEVPKVELPNNDNKLFDEDDDLGTSTIPDLSIASEEEKETFLLVSGMMPLTPSQALNCITRWQKP